MTTLEFTVCRKELRTAQEVLSGMQCKEILLVSQRRDAAVYRILIEEEQRGAVVRKLRQALNSFSIRFISKIEGDFLTRAEASDRDEARAFRGMNVPAKDGEPIMRRMFGFKREDYDDFSIQKPQ